ncbi:MAG: histidine--tRNA ligase [Pseudomonadota bacterium]
MAKKNKIKRPLARLPKGFRDFEALEIRGLKAMLTKIEQVYESYGFEPLETPAFEFTDALGKFLPDQDRPNAGVFSLQDEDDQWMSLRYDLTAPLARYVAQNFDTVPKPFRRYATGTVWRNEKPGPGRFRQFTQFDADTVGTESIAADAEICMLAAETLEALGFERGEYRIRVNNRKLLDGVLESIGIDVDPDGAAAEQRLTVLRAVDKLDRLGVEGVTMLLGDGRKDASGDFTKGAGLEAERIARIVEFVSAGEAVGGTLFDTLGGLVTGNARGEAGLAELQKIYSLVRAAGFDEDRIAIDPTIVRGLDYYTGPVFEAELTFEITDDDGQKIQFGSVGGGGRYDDLVARFTGRPAPATGFSIGVSRLQAALQVLGRATGPAVHAPVVVMVMDYDDLPRHQALVSRLRAAGVRAEMYLGTSGLKAQMKYADKRGAPCVVIQGEDEVAKGEVQIKDLIEGAKAAQSIKDNAEWKEVRPAQFSVPVESLERAVQDVLSRHSD